MQDRYIHFYGDNGYSGTEYHEFSIFDGDVDDDYIDQISADIACENAESYEYLATGWDGDFEDDYEKDIYYSDAASRSNWEEVTKERYEELKEIYSIGD